MGAAKKHRRAFLAGNPTCAFCGGNASATTIEHCPPRAMFQYRHWPEGFEFPACESCNAGSRREDAIFALIARLDPFDGQGDRDGTMQGLMRRVYAQDPEVLRKMIPTANEARRLNREAGLRPGPGQTHRDLGIAKVPDELHRAVCAVARKLAKGIFYRETTTIFPADGCILMNWFTNADMTEDGVYPVFDTLKNFAGETPPLKRAGKYLHEQFEYKLTLWRERGNEFALQAKFGRALGFAIFASPVRGRLEKAVEELRETTQRTGPFEVLQSPTLTPTPRLQS